MENINEFFKDRESTFTFFDLYSRSLKKQIDGHKTKNTLLKSYIFETFNEDLEYKFSQEVLQIPNLFARKNYRIQQIDVDLFLLLKKDQILACIEKISDRFSVVYTTLQAGQSDIIMNSYVKQSSILDSLWISGQMYDNFLEHIVQENSPHRFTNIKFDSKPLYNKMNDFEEIVDRESSTSSITQEIDGIQQKLNGVRNFFPIFNSISALRFPSQTGAGGHDVYYNGKITNRSSNFYDHRHQITKLITSYHKITTKIEDLCWMELERIPALDSSGYSSFKACPVTINFNSPLSPEVLESFINKVFIKGNEPFKIIGDVIRVDNNRFHIYGTDMHLWQNIFIDININNIILYLPKGTCGNTIHRFVTNVQKHLQPSITVSIGDIPYPKIIENPAEV